MLIERAPLNNICLERIIHHGNQLECECLEDSGRRDAMREEVVEFCADFEDLCWCVFGYDLACDLRYEGFPVWWRDGS